MPSYVTPRTPRISTSKEKLNSAETLTYWKGIQLLARVIQWAKQTKQGWGHIKQCGKQESITFPCSQLWAAKDGQVYHAPKLERLRRAPGSWSHSVPRPSSKSKCSVWHWSFTAQKQGVAHHKISVKGPPKQGYSTSTEISKRHTCTHSIKTQNLHFFTWQFLQIACSYFKNIDINIFPFSFFHSENKFPLPWLWYQNWRRR